MSAGQRKPSTSYLRRLWPRGGLTLAADTGFRGMGFNGTPSLAGTGGGLATYGERGCLGRWVSECLARRSPIFSLRSAVGIRLTRISTRDRSCWAWTLYWARNRRARSVTVVGIKQHVSIRDALFSSPSTHFTQIHTFQLKVVDEGLLLREGQAHLSLLDGAPVVGRAARHVGLALPRSCRRHYVVKAAATRYPVSMGGFFSFLNPRFGVGRGETLADTRYRTRDQAFKVNNVPRWF